jgi:hyperosmotically inducible protein
VRIPVLFLASALCASLAFVAPATPNDAAKDAWITTKAKVKLLTSDDVSITEVNVDTTDGRVTLHGKVGSQAEKARAEAAVRGIDGVREVKNLLQVVPESRKDLVKDKDEAIREKVARCLEADAALKGVKLASVNDGVVLLSGEIDSAREELRAIEAVRGCTSVRRVASEMKTREP